MKDKTNQNDKINTLNQEYYEEISKEQLKKGMIVGAMAAGLAGALGTVKPSEASAQTSQSRGYVHQDKLNGLLEQGIGNGYKVIDIIDGNRSEKYMYKINSAPSFVYQYKTHYNTLYPNSSATISAKDKTTTSIISSANFGVNFDASGGITKTISDLLNFGAKFNFNAKINVDYNRTIEREVTLASEETLKITKGQAIPTVFEGYVTYNYEIQKLNPDYVEFVRTNAHSQTNMAKTTGNKQNKSIKRLDSIHFYAIDVNSQMGKNLLIGFTVNPVNDLSVIENQTNKNK
ncbi:hypothetical protein [Bacillus sp. CDB3]|uniref:hypothetical protein n=1 Tax=Bacillus sp. CDB3 TaxID=360310 RepID=UPI0009D8A433|nr:hypothetical protein [Bacillus sp. CDB3]OQR53251.1 hypothetical protein CDB3_31085 [Bacillus sp. CDB3]